MYYYIYYILSVFARKYNNRSNDFAFTAIIYYFILIGLGVVFSFYYLLGKESFKERSQMVILLSCLIPATIHYFALLRNKKYIDVVEEYDSKFVFDTKGKLVAIFLVLYLIVMLASAFYLGSLARASK